MVSAMFFLKNGVFWYPNNAKCFVFKDLFSISICPSIGVCPCTLSKATTIGKLLFQYYSFDVPSVILKLPKRRVF